MCAWERDHTHCLVVRVELSIMAGNIEDTMTLRALFSPVTTNPPSCIVLPAITVTHFELKPHVIKLLPNFYGLEKEDPYTHVNVFLDVCNTFKFHNFSDQFVRLRLFPFSLHDRAKAWLKSLQAGSITS
jgi:hypothetical protein